MNYTHIVVHNRFHQDEALAIALLVLYGTTRYPGIKDAVVKFVDDPQGIRAVDLIKQGQICVGCGGGLYDEHNLLAAESTCSAEMVAIALGLSQDKAVMKLVEYVKKCDRTADVRPQELPSLIKRWHRVHPDEPQLVLNRAVDTLLDELEEANQFQREFQRLQVQKRRFALPDQTSVVYTVIHSDSPHSATVARIKGADIVIVRNSRGNVGVFTNAKSFGGRLDMTEVMARIRIAELTYRDKDWRSLTAEQLASPEKISQVPQWYYLKAGEMLLNGSDQAAPGVEATALSDDQIVVAIIGGTHLKPQTAVTSTNGGK